MKTDKQIKGDNYELFSAEFLLLKDILFSDENNANIDFDLESDKHKIEGVSGAKHQIDIHLTSTKNSNFHLLCECKCHASPVSKTLACSFVTVINDIKNKEKNWNIIPVFASSTGFNSGALKVLKYNKIIPINLSDLSCKTFSVSENTTITRPIINILSIELKDGLKGNAEDVFINYERGDVFSAKNIIGFYEHLDDNGNTIEDLVTYKGKFHTGKRLHSTCEEDNFLRVKDFIEINKIYGEVTGVEKEIASTSTFKLDSTAKAKINAYDGLEYVFYKDGTVKKLEIKP